MDDHNAEQSWPIPEETFQKIVAWCVATLWIVDIEMRRRYPLSWNEMQEDVLARSGALRLKPVTDAMVKPRQVGSTVMLICICIGIMVHVPNITIAWVNSSVSGANRVRDKFRAIWASLVGVGGIPGVVKDNPHGFGLANDSTLRWELAGDTEAGADDAGRADTIHLAIYSEMSTWEHAQVTLDAIEPAVVSTGGGQFVDSTPPDKPGQGEEYLAIVNALRKGRRAGTLFFFPWHIRRDYEAAEPATPPYDEEERTLLVEHSLTLRQIAWRREMIERFGPSFPYIYCETLDGALTPQGAKAFSPETIAILRTRLATGDWPAILPASVLAPLIPDTAGLAKDILLDPEQCRIYRLPEAPPPVPRRRLAHEDLDVVRARRRGERVPVDTRAALAPLIREAPTKEVEPLFGGVDSSEGFDSSDMQSTTFVDAFHHTVADLFCLHKCLIYASCIAELAALLGLPWILVETNCPGGETVRRYLTEPQDLDYLKSRGASLRLAGVTPRVLRVHQNQFTRVTLDELFLSALDDPDRVDGPWPAEQMLAWDPRLRKKRSGSQDDSLDSRALAYYCARTHPAEHPQPRAPARRLGIMTASGHLVTVKG